MAHIDQKVLTGKNVMSATGVCFQLCLLWMQIMTSVLC